MNLDNAALVVAATKEEIAAERAKVERFVLAITDSLTTLPTSELQSWQFRAAVWKDLDHRIQGIIDGAGGHEDVARMLLCLTVFRLVNLLLSGPLNVGKTDKQLAREAEGRMAKTAAKAKRKPANRRGKSSSAYYHQKMAKMSPEELAAYRAKERARVAAMRARKRQLVPGS
jgi:hypothetical protein